MKRNLLILGVGFCGDMAYETAKAMRCFEKISFLDDQQEKAVGTLREYEKFLAEYPFALSALDDTKERLDWLRRLEAVGFRMVALVSPSACISPSAQLMTGTVVGPGAVIQAEAAAALGCFVCAGAVIGQGAFVGDGCELGYNSVVGAKSLVPAGTKIGCGQVFRTDMGKASRCPDTYSFEVGV